MAAEMKRARVRPAIRRLAWWTGPVLLLIAAWQIWDAIEARRLQQALARVEITAPEPRVPRGQDDAARYYAAAAVAAIGRGYPYPTVQVAPGAPLVDVASALRDALWRGVAPPAPVLDALGQTSRDPFVLDLLAHASAFEFGGFRVGTEFNFRTSGLNSVDRLIVLETLDLIRGGHGAAASKALFDRVKSLRAFGSGESGWFGDGIKARAMREIAVDVGILVAQTAPSAADLSALDLALVETYASDELERSIRQGTLSVIYRFRPIWALKERRFVGPLGPLYRHHLVALLRVTDDGIQAARLPWPGRIHAMNKIPEWKSILPEAPRFIGPWRVVEDFRNLTVMIGEATAAMRCARLVIAIELFRREHRRLPETLDELMLPQGDDRSLDPFTGESLHYVRENGAYAVYSGGRDFKDDGGKLSSDLPRWQPAARFVPDVGVRVLLGRK